MNKEACVKDLNEKLLKRRGSCIPGELFTRKPDPPPLMQRIGFQYALALTDVLCSSFVLSAGWLRTVPCPTRRRSQR